MRWLRVLAGAAIGAVPGLILLVLSGPVEPELDLLLGVGGIFLIIVGLFVGTLVGALWPVASDTEER